MDNDNNKTRNFYLYGAAVQGIQDFIFQTNRLQEIVGASELVECICTKLFAEAINAKDLNGDKNAVLNAAGNIKYIFSEKDKCRYLVKIFPKMVMEFAPGVTISQAVVGFDDLNGFSNAVQELEKRLRIQRNRPFRDTQTGLMGIERSRQTGLPVTHVKNKTKPEETARLDSATYHKLYDENRSLRKDTTQSLCQKAFGLTVKRDDVFKTENGNEVAIGKVPFDIEDMTLSNDWIAIIHADGNGLGQVVQKIGTDKDKFRDFSRKLDKATTDAAVTAFRKICNPEENKLYADKYIPIRPVVLSGDDHTLICRADIAVPYIKAFIEAFEENTKVALGPILRENKVFNGGKDYLTACAGIAFIKSSFPFYYGYHLAEALCERAKKDTKVLYNANEGNLPPSCLMFHKVQDSFFVGYDDIARRELTPLPGYSFEFGPYYVNVSDCEAKKRWTVDNLVKKCNLLDEVEMGPVKSGLRNWLSSMYDNFGLATQKLNRMKAIANNDVITKLLDNIITDYDNEKRYPVYDILALSTINTQRTK